MKKNYGIELPYTPIIGYLCKPGKETGSGKCAMGYLLSLFWSTKKISNSAQRVDSDESLGVIEDLLKRTQGKKDVQIPFSFYRDTQKIETLNDHARSYSFKEDQMVTDNKKFIDAFYLLPNLLKKYEKFFREIDSEKYDQAVKSINSIIEGWSKFIVMKKKENPIVLPAIKVPVCIK